MISLKRILEEAIFPEPKRQAPILAAEILALIFLKLPPKDFSQIPLVCRRFRDITPYVIRLKINQERLPIHCFGVKKGNATNNWLTHLGDQEKYLTHLDLKHTNFTNWMLFRATQNLTMLRTLSLSGCDQISWAFKSIARLSYLQELNVSKCSLLTNEDFRFIANRITSLTRLSIASIPNIRAESIAPLLQANKLQSLKLSSNWWLDDGQLAMLTPHLTSIRELYLRFCICITGNGFPLTTLTNLKVLDISTITNVDSIGITPNIRKLDLSFSPIDDFSLLNLAGQISCLKVLNLSNCREITDDGIYALASHLQYLIEINLTQCSFLQDRTVYQIANSCPKIEAILLKGCFKINHEPFKYLATFRNIKAVQIATGHFLYKKELELLASPSLISRARAYFLLVQP